VLVLGVLVLSLAVLGAAAVREGFLVSVVKMVVFF
jgi:hypothetical protein